MRKVSLVFFVALLLAFTLSGCGASSQTSQSQTAQTSQTGGSTGGGSGSGSSAPSSPSAGTEQKFITIATGGSSGPYYTLGGALAKIYKEKLGYNTSVQSTGATVENINLLKEKKVDIAFGMSDAVSFAYNGEENFKESGAIKDLRAMAGLYLNYVQIITLKDKNIKSVADLKGKRVGVGAPNSGVEVNARMVLQGYGMTYNDLKPDYLSYAEAVEQMKNGTIDAAFVTSGIPNASVIDLSTTKEVEIVPIPPEDVEKLAQQFPFFVKAEIPAGVYKNDKPIPTAAIRNILLVGSHLSEDQVYKLTKTFFESLDELKAAHSAANEIDIETAAKDLVVPLHPGAEKYFKEIGKLQ